MEPIASSSKAANVLRHAIKKPLIRPRREGYLHLGPVPQSVLPGDIRRFLVSLNVPNDCIKGVLRGLTADYRPTAEYCIECTTIEATEDAVASAAALTRVPSSALRLFAGPVAQLRFATEDRWKAFMSMRQLLLPDFSGKAVRIGGIPIGATQYELQGDMNKFDARMVTLPLPHWYWNRLNTFPKRWSPNVSNGIVPLLTGSDKFLAYLVRFETTEEAHRIARLFHRLPRSWSLQEGAPSQRDANSPTQLTPRFDETCEVVY